MVWYIIISWLGLPLDSTTPDDISTVNGTLRLAQTRLCSGLPGYVIK